MIIKSIEIKKFRAIENMELKLGRNLTAIAGRNATLKTTLLGIIGQPFSISKNNTMYGCKTIDGYNFRSQFKDKFKISKKFDKAGEHRWTLKLYNNGYYKDNQIEMISMSRSSKSNSNGIRFWNAKSKARGFGYIQLPVYYLSLSRLFPIGESGKTKIANINLTPEESNLFLKYYREILSIQDNDDKSSVRMERGTSSRVFVGVNDESHDIYTNSAGESNVGRIILAILSFKRLKEKYHQYKAGILLIDEIDATLYGYSQKRLIDFLLEMSKKYNIQIIFTTHSPIILKQVNRCQRDEIRNIKPSIKSENISYDSTIIYLKPVYLEGGKKVIKGKNIDSANELNDSILDINLTVSIVHQHINVYVEDDKSKSLLIFLLNKLLNVNYENYINIVDVNLGWTNYIQLHKKDVPEFLNSIILLDNDVEKKKASSDVINYIDESAKNILFLPLDVEKGLFDFLKNIDNYINFEKKLKMKGIKMGYDICFRDWTEKEYNSNEYKKWFKYVTDILNGDEFLFEFWYDYNINTAKQFVNRFIEVYNFMAEKLELDYLIPINN